MVLGELCDNGPLLLVLNLLLRVVKGSRDDGNLYAGEAGCTRCHQVNPAETVRKGFGIWKHIPYQHVQHDDDL